ncbi:biotin carboxylase N-terminal domain-containing protein [Candidatus Coxiella mudrowiae]|uniref:biotin carboxylase N-terminal domain-containing protein n=1 Tax=Candidatus Coxiella mudrowiae TaxID=2054173 RepID=UPI000C282E8B|nr:biotin carboxylase N-terminal domain-containing protein [Candidatus Coxiella mudrowiae]
MSLFFDQSVSSSCKKLCKSSKNYRRCFAGSKSASCKLFIHPGYRFLSEDAKFASLCQQKEIIFIGSPPQAIEDLEVLWERDKREAKQLIEKAGVPVVTGYQDAFQDLNILRRSKL